MRLLLLVLIAACLSGRNANAQDAPCVFFSFTPKLDAANPAIQSAFKQQVKGLIDSFQRDSEAFHTRLNGELKSGRKAALQFGGRNCRQADVILRTQGTPGTHLWTVEYKGSHKHWGFFGEKWDLTVANPLPPALVIAELQSKVMGAAVTIEKELIELIANDPAVREAATPCKPPESNCAILPSMNRLDGWLKKSKFELHSASPEDENVQAEGRGICVPPVGIKVRLLNVGPEYGSATWKDNGVRLMSFVHPGDPVCQPASSRKVSLPPPADDRPKSEGN